LIEALDLLVLGILKEERGVYFGNLANEAVLHLLVLGIS
jgi:hypothetical protein